MVKKILIVFGTRPEAIKMAPVISELTDHFEVKVCVTAQHREMLDQVLNLFSIQPDYDLQIMRDQQNLFDITIKVLEGLNNILIEETPDLVLVHGDTTTSMAASLAAFYQQIKVGHVEAGLRTNNIYAPFPEEMNRQLVSKIANFHFAPTESAKQNLISENIDEENIFVTGNTVIDALFMILDRARNLDLESTPLKNLKFLSGDHPSISKTILVTGHRRENFGQGFKNICKAIHSIAKDFQDINIVYPVHLNPKVSDYVHEVLSDIKNVHLIEPLDYLTFIRLLDASYIVLTDSGGIQEEAPSLGKPVVVMRELTERPEAVEAGTVKVIGTNYEDIYETTKTILIDEKAYDRMSKAHNPYGDGKASKRIMSIIKTREL